MPYLQAAIEEETPCTLADAVVASLRYARSDSLKWKETE
jgi:hypothetical protein